MARFDDGLSQIAASERKVRALVETWLRPPDEKEIEENRAREEQENKVKSVG